MNVDMDALDEASDEANDSAETASSSDIPDEIQNAPTATMTPAGALFFEEIVSVGFTGDVDEKQNYNVPDGYTVENNDNFTAGGNYYGGSFAMTVRNPSFEGFELFKSTEDGQTNDYKLVGPENTEHDTLNGEVIGVKYGQNNSNSYRGELLDEFDSEYVTFFLNSGMGQYIMRRLDCAGGVEIEEYDGPAGLFEYPPDDSKWNPAVRTPPVLRPDMKERAGAIRLELGDNGAHLVDEVFDVEDEDNIRVLEPISSVDDENYREKDVYVGTLAFDHDGEGEESDESSEGSDESTTSSVDAEADNVEDALDMDSLGGGMEYDDLSDEWQAFVDAAVDNEIPEGKIGSMAVKFARDNDLDIEDVNDDIDDIVEAQR